MKHSIENYVVGPIATNCYFLINNETKEALIIDPGAAAEPLYRKLQEGDYIPVAILLTHGHFDHAGAVKGLKNLAKEDGYALPVYAYVDEKETLKNPYLNLSAFMGGGEEVYDADIYLRDKEEVSLAGFHFQTLFTPGHTPGGCCFYFKEEGICFTGDSLFCSSIGRTDFPGGSMSDLVRSVKEKVLSLPEDTICYPGHDSVTTVENEKIYNPFLA
ncbi:MAG: MBL fold metallo-hydrolase [Lachnospiraceae bacterium]|nr:MBL fold metallo-hydrolase [Lachnospiraceae bacterium]